MKIRKQSCQLWGGGSRQAGSRGDINAVLSADYGGT